MGSRLIEIRGSFSTRNTVTFVLMPPPRPGCGPDERLERTGMDAIAYPVGSDHGLYMWRPGDNNTLEVFQAKMEILGGI